MRFPPLASAVTLALPDWLDDDIAGVPDVLPAVDDRVALVNRLADRNWREGGGGPFAALVSERETGRIVSIGVNVVLASNVSLGHAEVMAIGAAQTRLGAWDLGGPALPAHELVVNWRPCVQCYGAALWSGITSLVLAGHGPECEELTGFDEGPMIDTWAEALEQRGIDVTLDAAKPEAVRVFEAYRDAVEAGDAVVYNARGG